MVLNGWCCVGTAAGAERRPLAYSQQWLQAAKLAVLVEQCAFCSASFCHFSWPFTFCYAGCKQFALSVRRFYLSKRGKNGFECRRIFSIQQIFKYSYFRAWRCVPPLGFYLGLSLQR